MWDVLLLAKAVVMGVVEGLTEFLPVSSTGHLILTAGLIGFTSEKAVVFEVVIQLAAILAVVLQYKARVVSTVRGLGRDPVANRFTLNVLAAFLPIAVLGLLFASHIRTYLFAPIPVALAFVFGGVVILWVERRLARPDQTVRVHSLDDMPFRDALKIGFIQAIALIPGMSRSGATIIGGVWIGFSRKVATEFSFFLAMPTILAASVYELYSNRHLLGVEDIPLFAVGSLASFLSAYACVRWLLRFVAQHDFRVFAWYRIAFGLLIVLSTQMGWVSWS